MTVGVTGLTHLGCVLAVCWAQLGLQVLAHDPDPELIADLRAGKPPIYEPGLAEGVTHPHLRFSSDLAGLRDCPLVFLALDTPVDDHDQSLLAPLRERTAALASVLSDGAIVMVCSQSPVGFCAQLRQLLQATNPSLELAYSPENLRLGEAIQGYTHPGTLVLGTANPQTEARCREYLAPLRAQIVSMSLESAETVKHGINSFLAMSIVFANQLANLCEQHGADIDAVTACMKADPRIGARAYLTPGVGFSGGTLGRDLQVMARDEPFFGHLWQLNSGRPQRILKRLHELYGSLNRVAVLGLTYKPGTSTLRRSVPLSIVQQLAATGVQVTAYDPRADLPAAPPFAVAGSLADALAGAELTLLLTAWPEFVQADWAALAHLPAQPRLFDAVNALKAAPGWHYASIGRPPC